MQNWKKYYDKTKKEKPRKCSEFDRLWYKPDSVFVNHLSKSIITYGF